MYMYVSWVWLGDRSQHVSRSKRINFTFSVTTEGPNMLQTSLRNNPRKDIFQMLCHRDQGTYCWRELTSLSVFLLTWSDDGRDKVPLDDKSHTLSISIQLGENRSRVIVTGVLWLYF